VIGAVPGILKTEYTLPETLIIEYVSDCIEYKGSWVDAYVCIALLTIIGNEILSYVPIVRGMLWKEGSKLTLTSRQMTLLSAVTTQLRAPGTTTAAWFWNWILDQLVPLIDETLKEDVKRV
jgi:hypothetical protein